MSQQQPALYVAAVAIAALVCATVAVCLGHLDSGAYAGIVGSVVGLALGAGAHAAGVKQGQP